jgi:outer membrane protein TolC
MAQTFRLWGKRGAEREAACAELAASQWEVQTLILDLYRQTAGGFAILLGAEQNLTYAEDRFRLAQEIESAVGVKVSEGAVPKAELLRAQASTALARVERGGHRQITTTEIYERVSDQDLPRAINRA